MGWDLSTAGSLHSWGTFSLTREKTLSARLHYSRNKPLLDTSRLGRSAPQGAARNYRRQGVAMELTPSSSSSQRQPRSSSHPSQGQSSGSRCAMVHTRGPSEKPTMAAASVAHHTWSALRIMKCGAIPCRRNVGCTTPHCCTTALLHHRTAAPPHCCTAAPPHCCTAALLHHRTAAPPHCCSIKHRTAAASHCCTCVAVTTSALSVRAAATSSCTAASCTRKWATLSPPCHTRRQEYRTSITKACLHPVFL